MSIKYFVDKYRQLEREGKLQGHVWLDDAKRAQLDALRDAGLGAEQLRAGIASVLADCGLPSDESARIAARFAGLGAPEMIEALLRESAPVGRREAWAAGFKAAVGINPTLLGLTAAVYTAPLFGYLTGPLLVDDPVGNGASALRNIVHTALYTAAGNYETAGGVVAYWLPAMTSDLRWRRSVNRSDAPEPADGSNQPDGFD